MAKVDAAQATRVNVGWFSLWMVIVALVLTNTVAVAPITVAMGVTTNNNSITRSSDQEHLRTCIIKTRGSQQLVTDGLAVGVAIERGSLLSIMQHNPFNGFAYGGTEMGPLSGGNPRTLSLWTTNITCSKFCLNTTSTRGNLIISAIDPVFLRLGDITANFTYPIPLVSPLEVSKIPRGQILLMSPEVISSAVVEKMFTGVYDSGNNTVRTLTMMVLIEFINDYLDAVKKTATQNSQNSVFYLVSTKAEVIAMSGFGGDYTAIRDGYQFVLVLGAPITDYVGDTLQLKALLEADGHKSTLFVMLSVEIERMKEPVELHSFCRRYTSNRIRMESRTHFRLDDGCISQPRSPVIRCLEVPEILERGLDFVGERNVTQKPLSYMLVRLNCDSKAWHGPAFVASWASVRVDLKNRGEAPRFLRSDRASDSLSERDGFGRCGCGLRGHFRGPGREGAHEEDDMPERLCLNGGEIMGRKIAEIEKCTVRDVVVQADHLFYREIQ
ncbi:hypothetical protein M427DRAFT_149401 [Gonapodya prolifera JEL478]|uniref:Uncharacterized protein n=1 Tax=Gonapodya prolifera (strain JEL478) TaxID=1344416 RepID=A0A138ZZE2_GONPJ|nr:hypothetical protein M427DRAFT_149401 [Gonapodya prolifera JEL478]|eukprot:KXS09861.1 hypothetical protein M427DRAFT_149401 [Gonapodya prolifera JEL478]